uniref:40S ribosomal protein S27 n=1 Tax=Hydra vulgaris TaxID=6087 RepID=T2MBC2_HYDVU
MSLMTMNLTWVLTQAWIYQNQMLNMSMIFSKIKFPVLLHFLVNQVLMITLHLLIIHLVLPIIHQMVLLIAALLNLLSSSVGFLIVLFKDLLHPSLEEERRKHKFSRLVPSPNSYFMDVKCPGCYKITTVFSHAQTVVLCTSCSTVLCQPTGGKARLTEGSSFRKKAQ